jgi:hypothetical protein
MNVFVVEMIYKNLNSDRKLTEEAEENMNLQEFFSSNNISSLRMRL